MILFINLLGPENTYVTGNHHPPMSSFRALKKDIIKLVDWIELNFNWTLTSREHSFKITQANTTKVGKNLLKSRLANLNKKIKVENKYLG